MVQELYGRKKCWGCKLREEILMTLVDSWGSFVRLGSRKYINFRTLNRCLPTIHNMSLYFNCF